MGGLLRRDLAATVWASGFVVMLGGALGEFVSLRAGRASALGGLFMLLGVFVLLVAGGTAVARRR